jgi:hypothetical protein
VNESGKRHSDAIERQPTHQEANEIRGAYTHAVEFWQERVRIMRWWADELDRLRKNGRVLRNESVKENTYQNVAAPLK